MMFWLIGTWGVIAQTGTWKAYMSYYEPQQIVKAEHYLFVRASNGLYSYNLNDHSITTYDKTTGLTDVTVSLIGWNTQAHRLIVVYDNQNIDLISTSGTIVNISALANKSLTQDKTVNRIDQQGEYAYLSCNFGIVKVNMQRAEVSESYMLAQPVTATAFAGGNIYARKSDGTALTARLTDNLLDASVWKAATTVPEGLFDDNNTDWDTWLETVKTLQPGGPRYNNFGFMKIHDGQLYTVGGYYKQTPATIQVYHLDNDVWTMGQEDSISNQTNHLFVNAYCLDIDPRDPDHLFVGARNGLYEYRNLTFKNYYNQDNSIINAAFEEDQVIAGVKYTADSHLWILNSFASKESIIELTPDGQWVSHPQPKLMKLEGYSLGELTQMMIDSRGLLWFVNNNWVNPSFYSYDTETKELIQYAGDTSKGNVITNQDGVQTTIINGVRQLAEDREGSIWVATSNGLFVLDHARVGQEGTYLTQIKVPRNDNSNYADYLMANLNLTCVAVDGANRKWIGTQDYGIYLISDDNMEQVCHFMAESSPLLSNTIRSITIEPSSGQVFISTDKGLCSYLSDAMEPADDMTDGDQIVSYPNPVPADYTGMITMKGFSFDADVKILTASGFLVAEGRSNGGIFQWNGCDLRGRRVASGVYMIAAAKSDGSKGVVGKIAIIR